MRSKWIPAPPPVETTAETVAAVRAAQRAIPLVPKNEAACLRRLQSRATAAGIADDDDARRWLLFLRSVGLVSKTASGYRRERVEPDATLLFDQLLEGVYGARELQQALGAAEEPIPSETAWDRAGVEMPTWERHHHGSQWEAIHKRRGRRLCEWFVRLGKTNQQPTEDGQVRYESRRA